MTPFLFHGPDARDRAQEKTLDLGRMLGDPIGDSGLKVADSRVLVSYAENPGVGDRPPSLMVGPLDSATPEAADALLKTLEDLSDSPLRIVLWTDYLQGVTPTIRSRCRAIWCPAGKTWSDPLSWLDGPVQKLLKAYREENWFAVMSVVTEAGKDWPDLVRHIPSNLDPQDPKDVALWGRLKKFQDGRGSYLVALDAVLPPDLGMES